VTPFVISMRDRSRGLIGLLLLGTLILAACGGDDGDAGSADVAVRPFAEVQAGDLVFEADAVDPNNGIFRVETTEPMICAIVWGETDALGRFNNSLAMNGTGITDHDVRLPGAEAGRTYHYVVQGTTADGTLYRSEPATFTIPEGDAAPASEGPAIQVGDNLALDAVVVDTSSEFSDDFAGALAIDGDLATAWSTAGDGDDGSITIDLGAPRQIVAVEFVTRSMADGSAITSTFTVSVDGAATVGPFPTSTPATSRLAPLDVTGQVLQLDVADSTGGNVGAVDTGWPTPAACRWPGPMAR
jgi:hypothetical protein